MKTDKDMNHHMRKWPVEALICCLLLMVAALLILPEREDPVGGKVHSALPPRFEWRGVLYHVFTEKEYRELPEGYRRMGRMSDLVKDWDLDNYYGSVLFACEEPGWGVFVYHEKSENYTLFQPEALKTPRVMLNGVLYEQEDPPRRVSRTGLKEPVRAGSIMAVVLHRPPLKDFESSLPNSLGMTIWREEREEGLIYLGIAGSGELLVFVKP